MRREHSGGGARSMAFPTVREGRGRATPEGFRTVPNPFSNKSLYEAVPRESYRKMVRYQSEPFGAPMKRGHGVVRIVRRDWASISPRLPFDRVERRRHASAPVRLPPWLPSAAHSACGFLQAFASIARRPDATGSRRDPTATDHSYPTRGGAQTNARRHTTISTAVERRTRYVARRSFSFYRQR